MAANIVVELLRDEDGEISVNKHSLGEWNWLGYVLEGSQHGGMCPIDFPDWAYVEGMLKTQFEKFQQDEGGMATDSEWEQLKKEYIDTVKEDVEEAIGNTTLTFLQIGGYAVEYDNCMVVIYGIDC